MVDDIELLRRSQRGHDEALRELLNRHGKYIFSIASALTGHRADADDVVQETLLACLKANFRGEASVRTWMVKILVRQVALLRRTTRRRLRLTATSDSADVPVPSTLGASDARIDLTTLLQSLSPDHREVIVLRELEGLSYDEIALALDVPRGTVESRLHRARDDLKKRYADPLDEKKLDVKRLDVTRRDVKSKEP